MLTNIPDSGQGHLGSDTALYGGRVEMTKQHGSHPQNIRLAIVDDFKFVTEGLAAHLASGDFGISVVILASSWSELIDHPEFPPSVTALDLNLNDGIPVRTKIHALLAAGSEVVVMSRHADPSSVYSALKAGALSYVTKSESISELIEAITSTAAGVQHLTKPMAIAVEKIGKPSHPRLGAREHQAIALYASGRSVADVALEMQTTAETVKSYIKRARHKYRDTGIELGSRALLRDFGMIQGWLDADHHNSIR